MKQHSDEYHARKDVEDFFNSIETGKAHERLIDALSDADKIAFLNAKTNQFKIKGQEKLYDNLEDMAAEAFVDRMQDTLGTTYKDISRNTDAIAAKASVPYFILTSQQFEEYFLHPLFYTCFPETRPSNFPISEIEHKILKWRDACMGYQGRAVVTTDPRYSLFMFTTPPLIDNIPYKADRSNMLDFRITGFIGRMFKQDNLLNRNNEVRSDAYISDAQAVVDHVLFKKNDYNLFEKTEITWMDIFRLYFGKENDGRRSVDVLIERRIEAFSGSDKKQDVKKDKTVEEKAPVMEPSTTVSASDFDMDDL